MQACQSPPQRSRARHGPSGRRAGPGARCPRPGRAGQPNPGVTPQRQAIRALGRFWSGHAPQGAGPSCASGEPTTQTTRAPRLCQYRLRAHWPRANPVAKRDRTRSGVPPYRRIRAPENGPDCVGYRVRKTRFCGRPPFHGGEGIRFPVGHPGGRPADSGHRGGCQRLTSDRPRLAGPCSPGGSGKARLRRVAVNS
jgi:hypothetical protein